MATTSELLSRSDTEISDVLAAARKEKNISKSQAARDLEVARQTYILWERGGQTPHLDNAERLAKYLDASVGDVVGVLLRTTYFADYDGDEYEVIVRKKRDQGGNLSDSTSTIPGYLKSGGGLGGAGQHHGQLTRRGTPLVIRLHRTELALAEAR